MREYYEYISIMDYNKVDDMTDIIKKQVNGQSALEQEIQELTEERDAWKQSFFEMKTLYDELAKTIAGGDSQ